MTDFSSGAQARITDQQERRRAKKADPTPEQVRVLDYLQMHGGVLVRLPGGFWTTPDTPKQRVVDQQWPEWSTTIQTVRAMEKKGLLQRTNRFPEEWRDDRRTSLPPNADSIAEHHAQGGGVADA